MDHTQATTALAAPAQDPPAFPRLRQSRVAIYRNSYGVDPVFLCFGTVLGSGMVATVSDRGIRYTREGSLIPSMDSARDLVIRFPGDARLHPADWYYDKLDPVVLLHVRDADALPGPISEPIDTSDLGATLGRVVARDYPRIWRLANSPGVFSDLEFRTDADPQVVEGYLIHPPAQTWFRNGAHPHHRVSAMNCHAGLDYPGQYDLGGPVASDADEILGVLIGADLGPESAHQGAFMPLDMILPVAKMCLAVQSSPEARDRNDRRVWRMLERIHHHDD